jgi:hypothetical protein
MKTPEPIEINGAKYFRVKDFAALTSRTTQSVYQLIRLGNAKRKLKCKNISGIPYVPIDELTGFPFIKPGPFNENSVYHYDEEGNIV